MSDLPPPAPIDDVVVVTAVPDEGKGNGSYVDQWMLPTPRVGDLIPAWRIIMIATWVVVFVAFAGVWKASEEVGIGTWWLGSRSQPTPVPVRMIPFAASIVVALLISYNVRRLPFVGLAAAVGVALLAVFDFRWSTGIAMVELGIAFGAFLVALGSLGGRYRAGEPLPLPDDTTPA